MSEEKLTLVFDGPAVENGEIDVRDLAPALLAIGELIQAANSEINGTRAQMSVKVKATAEGSFEVDLNLIQSLMENAKALFDFASIHNDSIAAANELADLLFKIVGGTVATGGGLLALIKFLKGRKPDRIEQRGGDVHIHIGDNYFVTNKRTVQIAESVAVREHAKKAVSTLSNDGIDVIKVRRPKTDDLEITKSEVIYFDYAETEEQLADETRTMTLQIISLSFKEDNKWRVTDGGEPFGATIEDATFLNQIANNEIAFSKGDYLVCVVRERQFRSSKGLKKERYIIEVKDHKPASKQLRLI
ncbi:hypothetical protein [Limnobacter sp. P1]|uniref:hypothetical protein n=1 Tax=Limnobacter olei TaxID=3031298 RepID=UPI0023AF3A04|nr:hypothetical protein [Limnobacter sp. P1]